MLLVLLAALHQPAPEPPAIPPTPSPIVREASPEICGQCVAYTVATLAGFGTRHTLSDPDSPTRGIGAARRWLKQEMESYGGSLQVSFEEFDAPPSTRLPDGAHVVNVVAVLPGTMPEASARRYYVVGHYDSRNGDAMDADGDAPGANDDASGTAVVVALAKALAKRPLESTVVFLCTAGEEQGLVGAAYHADAARAAGHDIRAVLNNDIVGDPTSPQGVMGGRVTHDRIRLFSEGLPRNPTAEQIARIRELSSESDSPSRQIARFIDEVARLEDTSVKPMIVLRPDRFLRGGDHSAFNAAGFPGVRFTELDEDYSRQHQNVVSSRDASGASTVRGDVTLHVDPEYLAGVARLNLAAIVHLANAPGAPANARMLTAELSNFTTLRWDRCPEPDTAGYEILIRPTTSWQWELSIDVGDVTEAQIELSKDDHFFAVRAYDRDGHRSPASPAGAAPR